MQACLSRSVVSYEYNCFAQVVDTTYAGDIITYSVRIGYAICTKDRTETGLAIRWHHMVLPSKGGAILGEIQPQSFDRSCYNPFI